MGFLCGSTSDRNAVGIKLSKAADGPEKNNMIGKTNQLKRAEQIKARINTEFDRIAKALTSSAAKQTGQDQADTEAVIVILEDKRTEIMEKDQASYFINNWRELNDEVREKIVQDQRYRDIDTQRARRQR
jgi:hypothetical protein